MNLNWLLVFIPIGVGLDWFGADPILVFLTSALAIVPLAGLMGDATEALPGTWGRPSGACSTPRWATPRRSSSRPSPSTRAWSTS